MTDEDKAKIVLACVGVGGTLLGTILGGLITWRITRTTQALQKQLAKDALKASERAAIDGLLVKMLDFLMTHPQLESTNLCNAYPNIGNPNLRNGERDKERYEVYCIFVFNFLMRAQLAHGRVSSSNRPEDFRRGVHAARRYSNKPFLICRLSTV